MIVGPPGVHQTKNRAFQRRHVIGRPRSMVTIITEKLQNQTLEDVTGDSIPVTIPQSSGNTWTFATTSSSAFKLTGDSGWATTLYVNAGDNQWRMGEQKPAIATQAPTMGVVTPGQCSQTQFHQSCLECEAQPNTPPAPPMKRHCRSLSIPGDGKTGRKWQPQASSVWRPVAMRTHHNNNKILKNRNSPHGFHHRPPSCTSPLVGQVAPSTGALRPLSKSEDFNFSTPPESPTPRPASAASGYYDSSFSSFSSAWLDTSPSQNSNNKQETYRLRSLSMEEPFSRGLGSTNSKATGSMPLIPGSQMTSSTPSSPRRQRVPRCRSQPSVLHERKCLKRRRDEERPALDFIKMKETAYEHRARRYSGTHFDMFIRSSHSLASLFTEPPECVLGLNTIASSPLDSNLPSSLSNNTTPTAERPISTLALVPKDKGDDIQFDSGCSDTNERSESTTFADSEENSCSCDDAGECANDDGPMFDLEINNDLDIDQIEKD